MNRNMAAPDQEQPDFQAMAGQSTELATNVSKFRNIPAFDGGALILAELQAMRQELRQEMRDMERRMTMRLEAA